MANLFTRHIKVSRFDKNGNDKSNTLSSLTNLIIKFSDDTKNTYKVLSITPKTDYFEFLVEYEPTGSIKYSDATTFDYSFLNRFNFNLTNPNFSQDQFRQVRIDELDANKQIVYDITLPDNNFTDSQFPVNNFNNASSYNVSNPGVWGSERNKYVLFDTYPQKDLKIEFSGSLTIPANQDAEFDLYCVFKDPQGNPIPPDQDTLSPNPTDGPFYVGGFFDGFTWNPNTDMLRIYSKQRQNRSTQAITGLPFYVAWTIPKGDAIPGSYLELYVQSQHKRSGTAFGYTATTTVTFAATTPSSPSNTDTRLRIIQTEPASATIPISAVLEPNFPFKFGGSDCDVLLNNVLEPRPNPQLQDIDYTTSQTIPVNYKALLSYTATKASYPESNFTVTSLINPIYKSENTVSNYNRGNDFSTQASAGTLILIYDDILLNYRNFRSIGGTEAEPIPMYDFFIKYIYTPDGQVIDAIPTEQNLKDCQYNFLAPGNVFTSTASIALENAIGFVSPLSGSFGTGSFVPLVNQYPQVGPDPDDPSKVGPFTPGNNTSIFVRGGNIILRVNNIEYFDEANSPLKQGVNTKGIIYARGIEYTSAANNINEVVVKIKTDKLLE